MKFLIILTLLSPSQDPWFAKDKVKHFAVSYISTRFLLHHGSRKEVAIGVSFSLGLAKEIYDKKVRKTFFSYKDLLWDIAGIALALI